jgi:hypothetical protein
MSAAAGQAVTWQRTADRSTWAAGGPAGTMLAVSRVAGGWRAIVARHGAGRLAAGDRGPVLPRRLAAQQWAERRAAR